MRRYLRCFGHCDHVSGDIEILIHGNAVVDRNVYGTNYESNVTVDGANVFIDIYENASLNRYLYGAGYSGTKTLGEDGVVIKIRDNAKFNNNYNVTGAAYSGTVVGNVSIEISDNAYVRGNVYGGGYGCTLTG